ncbi:MAG: PAS domain S-box protein, partial [Bacteroidales bacterium]|nr:PAS domain S-box protein [Bacteroidales bacterium]
MLYHQLKTKEELIIELQKLQEENESLKNLCDQNKVDHKHSLDALQHSENRYSSLVNNLPVGIFRSTIEGKVVSINPVMVEIYGYDSIEELLNVPATEYYSQDNDRNKMLTQLKKEGVLLDYQTLEKKKDGSQIWVSINYKLSYSEDRKENFIDGVVIDITDSVLIREKLKESEEKYRTMIETSNDLIWSIDNEGNLTFFNKKTEEVTGYFFKDWYGKSFVPLVLEDELPFLIEVQLKGLKGISSSYELRLKIADGRILRLAVNTAPIFDKGKVTGLFSFARDITEQWEAKKALSESEERFRRAVILAPNPIMIHDEDNQVLQLSAGWTKFSGYTLEDIPTIGDWTEKAYGERSEFAKDYIDKLAELT